MTTVNKTRDVPFDAHQMFDLVNDVEKYADFLPWCEESIVHYRDDDEIKASLVIGAHGMKKSFTTHNRLQTGKMIEIRLVDGPFKHLEGFWRFDNIEQGSRVAFDIEFEFSGKLLSMALGPVFHQVTSTMIDAFCSRAEELYG